VNSKNPSILYIFGFGRSKLINSEKVYPNDFFYGYFDVKDKYKKTSFIEFESGIKNNFFNKVLTIFSKILRKLTKLSFFFENICTYKNFKILMRSDKVVLTNDRIGLSVLPMLVFIKLIKRSESTVIVMGLLAKQTNTLKSHMLQRLFLIIFFKTVTNFMFLSKGEFQQAEVSYVKYKNKFHFTPFCIDTHFWSQKREKRNRNQILFVGNDGRRDYKLVVKIAENLPQYDFIFITSNITLEQINSKNVKLFKGHWNKQILSDHEMKDIYAKSSLSIIPIHNSYQPSGQSVALQSMSMGVPVAITHTDGFWDKDLFSNSDNILFVERNIVSLWTQSIIHIMSDLKLQKKISLEAAKTIDRHYKSDLFSIKLFNILEI
jgi:glycosyltransferase involved in cell wall biosynthesis